MGLGDKYQASLEAAVAPLIDGPLVIATFGAPVGSMGNLFRGEVFNLGVSALGGTGGVGMTSGKVENRDMKDVRLPTSFAVAITPSSVYFFKSKMFWGSVKIKKLLVQIPRQGLQVKISKGSATATVFLLVSEQAGVRTAFEMATLGMAKAKELVARVTAAFGPELAASQPPAS